jgi:hypothetical protein
MVNGVDVAVIGSAGKPEGLDPDGERTEHQRPHLRHSQRALAAELDGIPCRAVRKAGTVGGAVIEACRSHAASDGDDARQDPAGPAEVRHGVRHDPRVDKVPL